MSKKYIFLFAVSSFILTVVWILTNIYHSQVTTTIEPLLQTQIVPIEPSFDEEAIAELKKRATVEPVDVAAPIVSPTGEPSITPATNEGTEASIQPTPLVSPVVEEESTSLEQ